MPWKVRPGQHVTHDGTAYEPGQAVPCTDEQANRMLHAVERVAMVAEVPTAAVEFKAKRK